MQLHAPRVALLFALFATGVRADEGAPSPAPALLERVAVIGASVSHGWGHGLPLAAAIPSALPAPAAPVLDAAQGLFSFDPIGSGDVQVERCLEHRATLVIAVDFLFWYAYGIPVHGARELERRRERVQLGLAELERLDVPLVLGDLPDMRTANARMLVPALVPSPAVLAALNDVIREWCSQREKVLLVPLAAWVKALQDGEWQVPEAQRGGALGSVLTAEVTMQPDRLHPTLLGTLLLTDRVVAQMRERLGSAAAGLNFDLWRQVARHRAALGLDAPPMPVPAVGEGS